MATTSPPPFLIELLEARSPTGAEFEAQAVLDRRVRPAADEFTRDALGNRFATLNAQGGPTLMLAGHMDEIGFILKYADKDGFLYFGKLGGHDRGLISGRRVCILTRDGVVQGVTGKRAIHLQDAKEREQLPEFHHLWIDIGARSRAEALARVRIGDAVVYDTGFAMLAGSLAAARAFDNKVGCYVVCETLLRLAKKRRHLAAKVVAAATTQEEIGSRGATAGAYAVNPDLAVVVDVTHATDAPDCDHKRFGDIKLGAGPVLTRGPHMNPVLFERLAACAAKAKIPTQLETESALTRTDADPLQVTRRGVATALVSIPLRYMHTPSEVADLTDIENAVRLLEAFALTLKAGEKTDF